MGTAESTGGGKRGIEWAVGSNYVWVDGLATQEQYIIVIPGAKIDDAVVSLTLAGIASGGHLVYVDNYERKRVANLMKEQMTASMTETMKEIIKEPEMEKVIEDTLMEVLETPDMKTQLSSNVMTALGRNEITEIIKEETNNDPDPIGVAALVIGCVALLLGFALVASLKGPAAQAGNEEADNKTLGSKNVS